VDERNGWIKLKKDIESSNVPRILISPHAQFRLLLAERGIMDNRRYKFHSKSFIIVHYLFSKQVDFSRITLVIQGVFRVTHHMKSQ